MFSSISDVVDCMECAHPWDISGAKTTEKMRDEPRIKKRRDCGPLNRCVEVLLPFSVRSCCKHSDQPTQPGRHWKLVTLRKGPSSRRHNWMRALDVMGDRKSVV